MPVAMEQKSVNIIETDEDALSKVCPNIDMVIHTHAATWCNVDYIMWYYI